MNVKIAVLALVILTLGLSEDGHAAATGVVARVNGITITDVDLELETNEVIQRESYHQRLTDEARAEYQAKALDKLIERELQYQDARSRGMEAERKVVQARLDAVKEKFKTKQEFKDMLKQLDWTEDILMQRIEKRLLVDAVINKVVREASLAGEQELREHYDRNAEKYKQAEGVRLKVISAKDQEKVVLASQRIKHGDDFEKIAGEMSEDKFASVGGDIGVVSKGMVYPELEKAAYAMKAGEISDPILAEGIWFLVKVESKAPERVIPFEEVRDQIKKLIEKHRADAIKAKWMAELKSKAKIDIVSRSARSN